MGVLGFLRIIAFAKNAYKGEQWNNVRKSTTLEHAIDIALTLQSSGDDDCQETELFMAAILNDVMSHSDRTFMDLAGEDDVNNRVISIVAQISTDKSYSLADWREQKARRFHACGWEAKIITVVDKYLNCLSFETHPPLDWSPELIDGYRYWAYGFVKQAARYGRASDLMEEIIQPFFDKYGLTQNTPSLDEKIEEYYALLRDLE